MLKAASISSLIFRVFGSWPAPISRSACFCWNCVKSSVTGAYWVAGRPSKYFRLVVGSCLSSWT
ncbi:hypothetical protein [Pseudofrankia asymbiotica]|uniref:hypothetical protein n=1 Tax=Pseudofrankia asymbiotica TaxID=1834516 RepID=UPI001F52ABAE|nr:hypothetical protein [Pseudofrankia asymbiotica]